MIKEFASLNKFCGEIYRSFQLGSTLSLSNNFRRNESVTIYYTQKLHLFKYHTKKNILRFKDFLSHT